MDTKEIHDRIDLLSAKAFEQRDKLFAARLYIEIAGLYQQLSWNLILVSQEETAR